jgi:hypothetical protein
VGWGAGKGRRVSEVEVTTATGLESAMSRRRRGGGGGHRLDMEMREM